MFINNLSVCQSIQITVTEPDDPGKESAKKVVEDQWHTPAASDILKKLAEGAEAFNLMVRLILAERNDIYSLEPL